MLNISPLFCIFQKDENDFFFFLIIIEAKLWSVGKVIPENNTSTFMVADNVGHCEKINETILL